MPEILIIVKVEYAICLTAHTGSVAAIVDTQSSIVRAFAIIVEIILEVRVDNMFAFTPLPSPSASTDTVAPSPCSAIST